MCGDGANDCGALKAANVGISLSDTESSVASPFTSKEPNISCTTEVIKEGRAALVTSFGVFKLMLCYSLTEFASVIILYAIDSNLTSLQFLFIDICLVLNFASSFGKTQAHETLHRRPPMTSLLSFVPLASIVSFMISVVAVQLFSYYFIQTYDWFRPFQFDPDNTLSYSCHENYAVFCVSMFQYITMAIVFSKGKPYRKPIYTNYIFSFSVIATTAVCCYITLHPAGWITEALELEVPPLYNGRVAILVMALVNIILCVIVEELIVEVIISKKVKPKLWNIENSRRKYVKIDRDLSRDLAWPNTNAVDAVVNEDESGPKDKSCSNRLETTKF